MIKTTIFILTFLLSQLGISQNFKAIYNAQLIKNTLDPDSIPSMEYALILEDMNRRNELAVTQIEVVVIGNDKEYQVYAEQKKDAYTRDLDFNRAMSTLIDGKLIQTSFENETSYYVPRTLRYIRRVNLNNIEWTITKEEKYIDSIKAIKAIANFKIPELEYKQMKPLVCWFAPSIKQKGGPTAYANLPGLIIELETFRVLYKLKDFIRDAKFEFKSFNPKNLEIKNHKQFIEYYKDWIPKSNKK